MYEKDVCDDNLSDMIAEYEDNDEDEGFAFDEDHDIEPLTPILEVTSSAEVANAEEEKTLGTVSSTTST